MAEKSGNFLGGFILGTIAGSALGVFLGSKLNKILDQDEPNNLENPIPPTPEEISAKAKQGLETKIAQLNAAIDAVSQELTTSETNGKSPLIEKL